MESQFSSAVASSTSSAPSSSVTNNSNEDTPAPNGILPLSFLISFIGIFVFLLVCGFGSRRLSTEIRRNFGLHEPGGPIRSMPPVLWDVVPTVAIERTVKEWTEMTPLSATYVREDTKPSPLSTSRSPVTSSPPAPASRLPLRTRALDYIPFMSLMLAYRDLRRAQAFPGAVSPQTSLHADMGPPPSPVRAMQVSVLVAMPSPNRQARPGRPGTPRILTAETSTDAPNVPLLHYYAPTYVETAVTRSSDSAGKERAIEHPAGDDIDIGVGLGEYAIGISEVPWAGGEVDSA